MLEFCQGQWGMNVGDVNARKSRTEQPGAGAGSLSAPTEDKTSGMSTTPATRIPDTGMEEGEGETSRT